MKVLKLILSLAASLAVGALGSFFTTPEIKGWYTEIQKPSWTPPNWVFGPAWTLLYILMGIAFYLVWIGKSKGPAKKNAVMLYISQLILNFCWSFIFFGQHQMDYAFAEICLLWIVIIACIFSFAKINKTAAWLMAPYICWVSFAAMLNYTIWQMNS